MDVHRSAVATQGLMGLEIFEIEIYGAISLREYFYNANQDFSFAP